MKTELCKAEYRRGSETLWCQYIKDHPSERHSWFAIEQQDLHDQQAAAERYHAPEDEKELLERIEVGIYDSILEALLNAAHNRKRTLRNLRGFPNLERRASRR